MGAFQRLRRIWSWMEGIRANDVGYDLAPSWWGKPFYWAVGLACVGEAAWVAVTGAAFVGELRADPLVASVFMATLGLGWLFGMRSLLKRDGRVWLGEKRLLIPGRPTERISYAAMLSIDADGRTGLKIKNTCRFLRWKLWAGARTLRFTDRDQFVADLFRRIEEAEGTEFAANLRSS